MREPAAPHPLWIGTAGWTIPSPDAADFPGRGSHLERYAARFPCAEINSSFHRPHRPATYARWAASVPDAFRFSVKLPKTITHTARLRDTEALVDGFLEQAGHLGDRLGCLLVQLPPSLALDADAAAAFFAHLRGRTGADVACEPRHESWFTDEAQALLAEHGVARVAADPARVPAAAEAGGSGKLAYFRLHGSPRTYYSAYEPAYLDRLAATLRAEAAHRPAWCIFDNTAAGAATRDALELVRRLA
ncbi:MAG TPA: DUF72 domain-containing protein [Longimicrobium sp.]|nr:DUF72 domain-containing protein [Longimicrobium sp.]